MPHGKHRPGYVVVSALIKETLRNNIDELTETQSHKNRSETIQEALKVYSQLHQKDFKDILKKNRGIFLAILMMPVAGMVVAIPLIIWKAPGTVMVALPIIFLLIAQYILLVLWISRKMNQIIAS